jgi:hypothetical protein
MYSKDGIGTGRRMQVSKAGNHLQYMKKKQQLEDPILKHTRVP